jgi:hypothetical protein
MSPVLMVEVVVKRFAMLPEKALESIAVSWFR